MPLRMPSPKKAFLKSLLRKELRLGLARLKPASRRKKSRSIAEKLMKLKEVRSAKNIMAYMPLPSEVDTRPVLMKLLALRKNIFLPALNSQRREIRIFRVRNLTRDLAPGSYGILEPRSALCVPGRPSDLDLVLIPGVGFDRQGGRLGHGKGYFDKFLKKVKHAEKIGIAFREQILKKVPLEKHDQRVDRVITD